MRWLHHERNPLLPLCCCGWHLSLSHHKAGRTGPAPGHTERTCRGVYHQYGGAPAHRHRTMLIPRCHTPMRPTPRPDAYERHAKVCTPSNPGGPLGPNKHAPPPSPSARPTSAYNGASGGGGYGTQRPTSAARTGTSPSRAPPARRDGQRPMAFTCYLCGQQYGSQSLLKHIPQCQKKWLMVEGAKPRREQRPLPPMPPELEAGELPSRSEDIEEFNQRMYQYWDKVSLVGCPICARTFR